LLLQEQVKPGQQGRNETLEVVRVLVSAEKFVFNLVVRIGEQPYFHAKSGTDVDPNA